MKIVKAVKCLGPVDADENDKIGYKCVLCGKEWRQHMYSRPPHMVSGPICANCVFTKEFIITGDIWVLR